MRPFSRLRAHRPRAPHGWRREPPRHGRPVPRERGHATRPSSFRPRFPALRPGRLSLRPRAEAGPPKLDRVPVPPDTRPMIDGRAARLAGIPLFKDAGLDLAAFEA